MSSISPGAAIGTLMPNSEHAASPAECLRRHDSHIAAPVWDPQDQGKCLSVAWSGRPCVSHSLASCPCMRQGSGCFTLHEAWFRLVAHAGALLH